MPEPDPTLTLQLAELRARIEAQEAELAALKSARIPRRHLLRGLAGLGALGAAGVAGARPAAAADGDPILLGQTNTPSSTTTLSGGANIVEGLLHLVSENGPALVVDGASYFGIETSGVIGVQATGTFAAIAGSVATEGIGVAGISSGAGGLALVADSATGPSVWAESADGVTLGLVPAERVGPPISARGGSTPAWAMGAFSVDEVGDVWLCVETGNPGVWTRLVREDTADHSGKVIPIDPFRALDTRLVSGRPVGSPTIPGQKQGPLKGGEVISLALAGHGPLPADITGVLGNVTVVGSTFAGYVQLYPQGTAPPSTSAVNFASGATVANAFTARVGAGGLSALSPGSVSRTYHLVMDITGFVT